MSADNSETHSTDFKVKHLEAHGHRIILNDAARLLIVDDHMLPCTPTEYYLFTALLRSPYLPSARLILSARLRYIRERAEPIGIRSVGLPRA